MAKRLAQGPHGVNGRAGGRHGFSKVVTTPKLHLTPWPSPCGAMRYPHLFVNVCVGIVIEFALSGSDRLRTSG